jgi:glycosyltransferase involved in cell wall biosynthesis
MKILSFGDLSAGAIGIINRDIKKIMDRDYPEINFELMDWALGENYRNLFNRKDWKNWDLIIIDPYMASVLDSGWLFKDLSEVEQLELKNKFIPVYHAELDITSEHFNSGWYGDWFTTPVCSINSFIVNQIRDRGNDSQLLPIGISRERFKPFKVIKKIRKVGFVGNAFRDGDDDWKGIKRPALFKEICEAAELEYVPIFGKANNCKMYEEVDAVICTSISEGNPMGLLEATSCKIPFISTNVGIVREYSKVKTFETIEEAVEILNHLNASEDNIKEYVDNLHGEMFPDRAWENILEKYWIPYFKKQTNV